VQSTTFITECSLIEHLCIQDRELYGQETARLAREMNLMVNNIRWEITETNSCENDQYEGDRRKFSFVLSQSSI
jgi:hypothetical protein